MGLSLTLPDTDGMVGLLSALPFSESLTQVSDCRLDQCLQAQGSWYLPSREVLGLVTFGDGRVSPGPRTDPDLRMSCASPWGGRALPWSS